MQGVTWRVRRIAAAAGVVALAAGVAWAGAAPARRAQPPQGTAKTPAASQAAKAAKAAHLTKAHSGWRQTPCLDCHEAAALAPLHPKVTLQPAECGPCHGYNGAPHEDHALPINACLGCHASVEHAAGFETPGACIKCHFHPDSPKGK